MTPEDVVRSLPCWQGAMTLSPLAGGMSNAAFIVTDDSGRYVARVGDDHHVHHISRAREATASRAAASLGLSPELIHEQPGVLVLRYLDARPLSPEGVRARLADCAQLIRRCHSDMAHAVSGPPGFFWVFHVLRDYAQTLRADGHAVVADLPRLLAVARELEHEQVPLPIVFTHNDLLAANFLDDGQRLWLIDWEFSGFGTAMFDLASLAANNGLTAEDEDRLLTLYFGHAPDRALARAFSATKAAAALREALWGHVSGIHLRVPGVDYDAYAAENLARFEACYSEHQKRFGS